MEVEEEEAEDCCRSGSHEVVLKSSTGWQYVTSAFAKAILHSYLGVTPLQNPLSQRKASGRGGGGSSLQGIFQLIPLKNKFQSQRSHVPVEEVPAERHRNQCTECIELATRVSVTTVWPAYWFPCVGSSSPLVTVFGSCLPERQLPTGRSVVGRGSTGVSWTWYSPSSSQLFPH